VTDPNWFGRAAGAVMHEKQLQSSVSKQLKFQSVDAESKSSEHCEEGVLEGVAMKEELKTVLKSSSAGEVDKLVELLVDSGLVIPMEDHKSFLVPSRLKRKEFKLNRQGSSSSSSDRWIGVRLGVVGGHHFSPDLMNLVVARARFLARDPEFTGCRLSWGYNQLFFELDDSLTLLIDMADSAACSHIDMMALVKSSSQAESERMVAWLRRRFDQLQETIRLCMIGSSGSNEQVEESALCPKCLSAGSRHEVEKQPNLELNSFFCKGREHHDIPASDIQLTRGGAIPLPRTQFPTELSSWSAAQVRKWFSALNPIHCFILEQVERRNVATDGKWLSEVKSVDVLAEASNQSVVSVRELWDDIRKLTGVVEVSRMVSMSFEFDC